MIKTFLKETVEALSVVNRAIEKKETVDSMSRKTIQAHMLAKNVAQKFVKHLKSIGKEKEFGDFFSLQQCILRVVKKRSKCRNSNG